jgi:hypothetical protein
MWSRSHGVKLRGRGVVSSTRANSDQVWGRWAEGAQARADRCGAPRWSFEGWPGPRGVRVWADCGWGSAPVSIRAMPGRVPPASRRCRLCGGKPPDRHTSGALVGRAVFGRAVAGGEPGWPLPSRWCNGKRRGDAFMAADLATRRKAGAGPVPQERLPSPPRPPSNEAPPTPRISFVGPVSAHMDPSPADSSDGSDSPLPARHPMHEPGCRHGTHQV